MQEENREASRGLHREKQLEGVANRLRSHHR
jgi:hypothetical protein